MCTGERLLSHSNAQNCTEAMLCVPVVVGSWSHNCGHPPNDYGDTPMHYACERDSTGRVNGCGIMESDR